MKKHNIIKTLLFASLLTACAGLAACGGGGNEGGGEGGGNQPLPPVEGVVNGFDTVEELYETRFKILDSTFTDNYKATINTTETEYIRSGTGSVRFEYHGSATNPGFIFYGSKMEGLDLLTLKDVSLDVYNACEHDMVMYMHMHGSGWKPMYTEMYTVPSCEWTRLTLPINNVVMQYNASKVLGFGVEFKLNASTHSGENEKPCVLYMDNLATHYGVELTEEDTQAKASIDAIIEKINNLPSSIDMSSEQALLDVFTLYNDLPSKYRGAVTNYDVFTAAANKFVAELNKSATEECATVIFMDKFVGSTQFRESPTFDETAIWGYTTEEKFGDESGSTYIYFDGTDMLADDSAYMSWFWSTSATLSDYDYVGFAVKNDTDQEMAITWTWKGLVTLKPGDWKLLTYPISVFSQEVKELETWSCANAAPVGKLYFSAIKAYAGRVDGLTDPALTETPYTLDGDAEMTTTDEGVQIQANAQGDVTLALSKRLNDLSVGEYAYLNIKTERATTLYALNANGETVYEIPVQSGWNTVSFITSEASGYNLNNVSSFRLENLATDEKVVFGDFLLGRSTNKDAALVLMQSKYVTVDDVVVLAKYINSYYALPTKAKVLVATEYADVETDIAAQAESMYTSFTALIDSTYAHIDEITAYNKADATKVKTVYEIYKKLDGVTPLTAEQDEKAKSIVEKWDLLPHILLDAATEYGKFSNNTVTEDDFNRWVVFHWGNRGTTYSAVADDTHGAVITGSVSTAFQWGWINFNEGVESTDETSITDLYKHWQTKLSGIDKVVFYVYNPQINPHRIKLMSANAGISATDAIILSQGWNMITIEAAKFLNVFGSTASGNPYIFINFYTTDGSGQVGGEISVDFKFSSFYGYTEKGYAAVLAAEEAKKDALAQEAIALINGLPDVNTLTVRTPSIGTTLANIVKAYEKVGDRITNYAEYEAFVEKYNLLPALLLDASADLSKFSSEQITNDSTATHVSFSGMKSTFTNVQDTTHGTVVQAAVTAHNWTAVGYISFNAGVEDVQTYWVQQLSGLDKIVFYFYNGYTADLKMNIRGGNLNNITTNTLCAKGEWTMITVDVATFLSGFDSGVMPYIAFGDNGNPNLTGATFKFTSFYGYTNAQYEAAFPSTGN